jgi:hypothetical protein
MRTAVGSLLLWFLGVMTFAALLIAREVHVDWRARRDLPPATPRQLRAARAARRLQLPALNTPDDDTPT